MSNNPATPLHKDGRTNDIADEQNVGDRFEGESERERKVGREEEVVVEVFRRDKGPEIGTYFMRVSLRSQIRQDIIMRHDQDVDRYSSEADFLSAIEIGAGALAEHDCETRGASWDASYVAAQARSAAAELLHGING